MKELSGSTTRDGRSLAAVIAVVCVAGMATGPMVSAQAPPPSSSTDVNALQAGYPKNQDKSAVTCAPADSKRFVVIYAHPRDLPDRSQEVTPLLRQAVYDASGFVDFDAKRHVATATARYRVECDAAGDLVVHTARLRTPSVLDSAASLRRDLQIRQFRRENEKYIVFYDDCLDQFGGGCDSGALAPVPERDSSPTADNLNNRGPDYAFDLGGNQGSPYWFALAHEVGHTLGAVQPDAPNSDGQFHCTDGWDMMCDLGPRTPEKFRCPVIRFDCGGDDYFNPNPVPGSYIATHWNLASKANEFFDHD